MFPYWPGSFRAYHRNFDDWFETTWESWVRCAPPVSKDLIGESKCKRSSVVVSTVRASGWSFDCSEDCMVAITFLLASAVAEASKSVFARLQGLPMSRISFVPNAHLTCTALKPLKNNTAAPFFLWYYVLLLSLTRGLRSRTGYGRITWDTFTVQRCVVQDLEGSVILLGWNR